MDSKALEAKIDAWAERKPKQALAVHVSIGTLGLGLAVGVVLIGIGIHIMLFARYWHPVFSFDGIGITLLVIPVVSALTAWSAMMCHDYVSDLIFHKEIDRKYDGPILRTAMKVGPAYGAALLFITSAITLHRIMYGGITLPSRDLSGYEIPVTAVLIATGVLVLWYFYMAKRGKR